MTVSEAPAIPPASSFVLTDAEELWSGILTLRLCSIFVPLIQMVDGGARLQLCRILETFPCLSTPRPVGGNVSNRSQQLPLLGS
jgi:hypothetical protein